MSAVKKLKAKSAPLKAAKKAPPKAAAKPGKKITPKKVQAKPRAVAPKVVAPKVVATTPKAVAAKAKPKAKANGDLMSFKNYEPYPLRKGEEYMNDAQEAHFRNILNSWKKELMEEVDRTMHYMQDEAANFPDPNDRASQESDFTLELRARDRERKLIKKIDEAMQRLDNHEYGECESCGVEIGIRRLEARPTATLCIDCKTLDEIREKQMGD
jgi:RNA polymerase-binding transcription factor